MCLNTERTDRVSVIFVWFGLLNIGSVFFVQLVSCIIELVLF